MMRNKNINVLLILVLLLFASANGNAASTCTGAITSIYYVNGVNNSFAQAEASRIAIQKAYEQDLNNKYQAQAQQFRVKLSYNTSMGMFEDLVEVYEQKKAEQGISTDTSSIKILTSIITTSKSLYDNYYADEANKKELSEILVQSLGELYSKLEITDQDLGKHTATYLSELQKGNRVLLIAHSQGNLFANASLSSLINNYSSNVGMIGVASPASTVLNNSKYYTAHDDLVIDALRQVSDKPILQSNIDNSKAAISNERDSLHHSFLQSYFKIGLPSRSKIDTDVYDYMELLQCDPDLDNDGYDADNRGGDDCDDRPDGADGIPGNADDGAFIHPNAVDTPGDGIDQDCDGVDAAVQVSFPCPAIFKTLDYGLGEWDWPLSHGEFFDPVIGVVHPNTFGYSCTYAKPAGLADDLDGIKYPPSVKIYVLWETVAGTRYGCGKWPISGYGWPSQNYNFEASYSSNYWFNVPWDVHFAMPQLAKELVAIAEAGGSTGDPMQPGVPAACGP